MVTDIVEVVKDYVVRMNIEDPNEIYNKKVENLEEVLLEISED